MRFRLGAKPYATDFDPAGWTAVETPNRRWSVAAALLLAGLVTGALVVLARLVAPGTLQLAGYRHWQVLVIFVLTVPVHELVHAVLQPGLGRDTTFGFWPRRLVFYAFYPGPRTRARTLAGAAGPFVVLSVVPLLVAGALDLRWWGWAALALINGAASANDLLGFAFVLIKIPPRAEIMGQPARGYWRHPPTEPDAGTAPSR